MQAIEPDIRSIASPVVEGASGLSRPDSLESSVRHRIRQQEILSELGVYALQDTSFLNLLNLAARLTAEGLGVEFCKVLEHLPGENRLLVRAGVGWNEGVVGISSVSADIGSPAGYALRTGKPVISNHLGNEERFKTPELLAQHGIHRAMNVILQGDRVPFGVLEADSRSDGEFSEEDIPFLQGAANILGMAIERQLTEGHLKAALDHQRVLVNEINHRAKNSLQLVAGMLHLQAKSAGDETLTRHLNEASSRISAVGRLYDRLSHDTDIEKVDLGSYLTQVCNDLAQSGSRCELKIEASPGIEFAPDRAIHVALIVNELVTNACKYAYPDDFAGHIRVSVKQKGETACVSIRDDGVGLPKGFDVTKSKGLGMRIATNLATQLGAALTSDAKHSGTLFELVIPMKSSSPTLVAE